MYMKAIWVVVFLMVPQYEAADDEEERRTPSLCEVCKFLATELKERLVETGKSKEVLETGHGLDKKKKIKYSTSELRLTEAVHEPHVCERILEYNIHAEKKGSQRYAKGRSETMQTLHGLVDKGVKVELGMPYEMWDKPSAEVTQMQRKCFSVVEDYEEDIEEWYYHHQGDDLMTYLCSERVLKNQDQGCLTEGTVAAKKKKKKGSKNKKLKGDPGAEEEAPSGEQEERSEKDPVSNDDTPHEEL